MEKYYTAAGCLAEIERMAPVVVAKRPLYPFRGEASFKGCMKKDPELRLAVAHLMYNLQGSDEQNQGFTSRKDSQGFTISDSHKFTEMFKGYWTGKDFTQEDIKLIDSRVLSYAGQTLQLLIEKACETSLVLKGAAKKWKII